MFNYIITTYFYLALTLTRFSSVYASPVLAGVSLQERAPYIYQGESEIITEPRGPDFSGDLPPMWPAYSWQHDLADPSNLIPVHNKILYYTDSGSRGKL